MKSKALGEHRTKSAVELQLELVKLALQLEKLRFELAAGKVKNVRELRSIRTSISQIRTILGEHRRAGGAAH